MRRPLGRQLVADAGQISHARPMLSTEATRSERNDPAVCDLRPHFSTPQIAGWRNSRA
ncbi:hypothetical protein HYPGJ_30857 [Hyphomicrobium sp. GJ21]|nr:hypothetical protein HYPGJ_30857 [Hyphomicrobium sp. GJ21]